MEDDKGQQVMAPLAASLERLKAGQQNAPIPQAEYSRRLKQTASERMNAQKRNVGEKSLALKQGMAADRQFPSRYRCPKSPETLRTSNGSATEEPLCGKCNDAGHVLIEPLGRPSAGAWDHDLQACQCRGRSPR